MDEFYRIASALPKPLATELTALDQQRAPTVQEIRLRAGQAVQLTIRGKQISAQQYLPGAKSVKKLSGDMLQSCFLHLCQHSVYAYEEELRQGYFTIPGGCRIGVAGFRNNGFFSSVTSLNLRIARWITCELPEPVRSYLVAGQGGLLVAGTPGSGKTTFLRTIAQELAKQDTIVCVVDERGELMAGEENGLPMAESIHCDVYTHCAKGEGITMALRCMNPQYLICDELGTEEDVAAAEQATASGVHLIASVHCENPDGLQQKPQLKRLLHTGAFAKVAFLDGRERPGRVVQWMSLS